MGKRSEGQAADSYSAIRPLAGCHEAPAWARHVWNDGRMTVAADPT
jgi:hypothetical protein